MFPTVKLGPMTTKVGSGATPRGGANVYTDDGVALIRSQNVLDFRMKLDDVAHLTDEAAHALRGVTVEPDDVLLNITGDSIARCCVVDLEALPARVSQHVAIVRTTKDLHSRFLQYALLEPAFKRHLIAISDGGGTRKALTKAMIEGLVIPLPPFADQRAIAEVLGALDDKIAATAKAVRLILDLADAYFVSALTEATVGPRTFGDVADVGGGGTPRTGVEAYWGGDIDWATPTDVTALAAPYLARTSRKITAEGLNACASALYPAGSILMTSRATIGAFAVAQVQTAVNQGFIVVNAKEASEQWWLFHEMKSRVPDFLSHANGATFLELPRGRFKDLKVRLASPERMGAFGDLVGPLHVAAAALTSESTRVAGTRDELLPLLMSGKVRVKDAENTLEGVL